MPSAYINEFVFKLAARCNIDCHYCYEFNLGDETWRSAARLASEETARALGRRIAEYAGKHSLDRVMIGLHGGEPLLVGATLLDRLVTAVREEAKGAVEVDVSMQTNGILIDRDVADVIVRHNIAVGISIDGSRAANDRHRLDHRGRSTFDATLRGIETLKANAPKQLSGLLAVIDVRNDPLELLDFFGGFGVPYVDFLLPHETWDRRPLRPNDNPFAYAEWYFRLYQAWVAGRQSHLRVRFLEQLIRQIVGGRGIYEQNTLEPVTLLVVNSSGEYEAVDSIKGTASGLQRLGFNVFEHTIDEVAAHPLVRIRMAGLEGLCDTCQACDRVRVCGGGYFPHRYGRGKGFENPSVYCSDLYALIGWLTEDLRSRSRRTA